MTPGGSRRLPWTVLGGAIALLIASVAWMLGVGPGTAYGMHRAGSPAARVGPSEAQQIADAWLTANRPGESAAEPDAFPGYYTLHTMADGEVTGMLSVHAVTGAVWHHSWPAGRFVAMAEAGEVH